MMEVKASPSPLLFTEDSGSAAIVTDKAQRWEFFRVEESHSKALNTNGSSSYSENTIYPRHSARSALPRRVWRRVCCQTIHDRRKWPLHAP